MSIQEYIKKEIEQIKRDCEKYQITPEEWISRFAAQYYTSHVKDLREALEKERKE